VQESHPLGVAPAIGFVLCGLNVRPGGLDVHGGADPVGQKLVVQHPDARADVEERVGSCVAVAQHPKEPCLWGPAVGMPRAPAGLGPVRSGDQWLRSGMPWLASLRRRLTNLRIIMRAPGAG